MNKHIFKIDFIIISVSVLVLIGVVGYAQPLVIAPLNEYESLNGEVLFEFERADVLLIDDNLDFTSPDKYEVENGLEIRLEPGVYYWKVAGLLGSEVRTLTIESVVELILVESEDGFGVVNAGNVGLNVEVYDGGELIEKNKLNVGEVSSSGDNFVGEYDE